MQQRACGLVIFRRFQDTIQFLLMQTSYGQHHWTPPKGHVDPGESDMETALRETQEEAGFTSSDLKIFEDAKHEMTYQVNGRPKIVIYWLAELLNPDKSVKLSNEHQAYEWLSLREACDVAKYAEMQRALNEFDKILLKILVFPIYACHGVIYGGKMGEKLHQYFLSSIVLSLLRLQLQSINASHTIYARKLNDPALI